MYVQDKLQSQNNKPFGGLYSTYQPAEAPNPFEDYASFKYYVSDDESEGKQVDKRKAEAIVNNVEQEQTNSKKLRKFNIPTVKSGAN
jgi:hypothetical protein